MLVITRTCLPWLGPSGSRTADHRRAPERPALWRLAGHRAPTEPQRRLPIPKRWRPPTRGACRSRP